MIKERLLLLVLFVCVSTTFFAQSLVVTQSFQELPNTTVLDAYGEKFSKWRKLAMDDTFPYVLIRVGLEGTPQEIVQAKQMLSGASTAS